MKYQLITANVTDGLKQIADKSVQCIVTSPPYYGLREYQTGVWTGGNPDCDHRVSQLRRGINLAQSSASTRGGGIKAAEVEWLQAKNTCPKCGAVCKDDQIGKEDTPDLYVARLVDVFRDARRVLRDDGTLFLNLGDSYFGSGKGLYGDGTSHGTDGKKQRTNAGSVGVGRAALYGTSGKALEGYRDRGCLCESLCGVCRTAYRNRTSRNDRLPASMLISSLFGSTRERMGLPNDRLPTSDLVTRANRILTAIEGCESSTLRERGQLVASLESKPDVFSLQLLDECLRRDNSSLCLLCGRTLLNDEMPSARKLDEREEMLCYNQGNGLPVSERLVHNQYKGMACECCASLRPPLDIQPQYTAVQEKSQYGLKSKDLIGIPWRVALALQADGWYLRCDIIWAKPNPMPESVTDRPTKSHEYIFLLSKSQKYFYDTDAVREPFQGERWGGDDYVVDGNESKQTKGLGRDGNCRPNPSGRNCRSVWTIATQSYKEAHFATYPQELARRCIAAGSKVDSIVLDPFSGSGTTGLVAMRMGRDYIGIDLNPKYNEMAERRFATVGNLL